MKKILLTICFYLLSFNLVSAADKFTTIAPQEPNQPWLEVLNKEWQKKLNAEIVIRYSPGARDIPGANKWQQEYQFDNNNIMMLHGGNAESFLLEDVKYDYKNYAPIGLQNLTIVVGKKDNQDVEKQTKFAYLAGTHPDAMAITMMICGPKKTMEDYLKCYNEKFVYINGLKGGEVGLTFARGESNVLRAPPPKWNLEWKDLPNSQFWFSHGYLDLKTGQVVKDHNYPGSFSDVYEKRWGVKPSGDFYDAYILLRNYRDVLQKTLWVRKDNPNIQKLRTTLQATINDPESSKVLKEKIGDYPWLIGDDVTKAFEILKKQTTEKSLKNLVWWHENAFKQKVIYKEHLVSKVNK